MHYYKWIEKLENTRGNNAKLDVLKEALSKDKVFESYVKQCYNPFFNPWIRKLPDLNGLSARRFDVVFPMMLKFLEQNKSRSQDVVDTVYSMVISAHHEEQPYLLRFLARDMRCGISIGLINKAAPGLIPEFKVSLAQRFDAKKLKFPCIVDPKLDGVRCLAFVDKDNGVVEFRSRNGKPIELDDSFAQELLSLATRNFVFDGELMGSDFQQLMTQMKRLRNKDQSKLKYYIFDVVHDDMWLNKTHKLHQRKVTLDLLYLHHPPTEFKRIAFVPWTTINSRDELNRKYNICIENGFEGIMIKNPDAPYIYKRSFDVMKWKPFETYDVEVIGFEEGTGKYQGTLGALVVNYNENSVNVGSGFTDEERDEIWANQDKYLGLTVEVQAQEVTNDDSLRFPVFKTWRLDK